MEKRLEDVLAEVFGEKTSSKESQKARITVEIPGRDTMTYEVTALMVFGETAEDGVLRLSWVNPVFVARVLGVVGLSAFGYAAGGELVLEEERVL